MKRLPEGTFVQDAEANGLKRFKGSEVRGIIVLEFDPAGALGDPAERVIKIPIRLANLGDDLFERLTIDPNLFQKLACDLARWRAFKFDRQLVQKLVYYADLCL